MAGDQSHGKRVAKACSNSGQEVADHLARTRKLVRVESDAKPD